MKEIKPNIIISLPIVWSIRNVFYSGLNDELLLKYNIYYIVPKEGKALLSEQFLIPSDKILLYPKPISSLLKGIISNSLIFKFEKKLRNINKCFRKRRISSIKVKLRLLFSRVLARFFNFYLLETLYFNLIYLCYDKRFIKRVKLIEPVLILSTAHVTQVEQETFIAFKKCRFNIVAHILSFDNFLSRGYIPISHFNKVMVWNSLMKDELIHYYRYPESLIYITGTPQFDLNTKAHPDLVYTKFNLMKEEKILLYCANHFTHTPTEPFLVKDFYIRSKTNNLLAAYKWIVRLHPLDDYSRWDELKNEFKDIIIDKPWKRELNTDNLWELPSKDEVLFLGALIKSASVVLNIASTITLDAIFLDRPVVCVGFSSINTEESRYYNEVHYSAHYLPLTESGAINLANTLDEFFYSITQNLIDPKSKSDKRNELRVKLIGDSENSVNNIINALKI